MLLLFLDGVAATPKEEGPEEEGEATLPALWFNLFPRTPCDAHSLVSDGQVRGDTLETASADADAGPDHAAAAATAAKTEIQPIPYGRS